MNETKQESKAKKEKRKNHSLPILHIPIALRDLRPKVDEMAPKQQIVLRRDGQGVAHKGAGIQDQGARHAAGYANNCVILFFFPYILLLTLFIAFMM